MQPPAAPPPGTAAPPAPGGNAGHGGGPLNPGAPVVVLPSGSGGDEGGVVTPPADGLPAGASADGGGAGSRGGWHGLGAGSNGGPLDPDGGAVAAAAADKKFLSKSVGAIDNSSADSSRTLAAAALIRAAHSEMDLNDNEAALRDLNRALALSPNSAEALNLRAAANYNLGRFPEAGADAKAALDAQPDASSPAESLAWSLLRMQDYDGAQAAADLALKNAPQSAKALAARALARQRKGDMAGARADMEAAAALDSRYAEWAALARAGKLINLADPRDSAYLSGLGAGGAEGSRWPLAAGAVMLAAGLGAFVFAASRRRKEARLKLTPARPDRDGGDWLLGGKYRLQNVVGRGGMGEVRRAVDVTLGRPVAVKTLTAGLDDADADWRGRLRAEALAVAAVHHPNIVDIYEIVEEGGSLHLVFEYVEGQTVHGVLAQRGRLKATECARILAPVCEALAFAHSRGLVHRDLKPANIMIAATGHVKLMDFGIARPVGRNAVKEKTDPAGGKGLFFDRTATVIGTPLYMSPEAERGMVGPAGDVYSLGVCLYEMLTSARPYPADADAAAKARLRVVPPSASVPGLSDEMDRLVAMALSADPADRPKDPLEFSRLLRSAASKRRSGGTTPRRPITA